MAILEVVVGRRRARIDRRIRVLKACFNRDPDPALLTNDRRHAEIELAKHTLKTGLLDKSERVNLKWSIKTGTTSGHLLPILMHRSVCRGRTRITSRLGACNQKPLNGLQDSL